MEVNGSEPKLTREQRRKFDRFNEEAQKFNQKLVQKYYDFFMDNDPDGPEVAEKQKEINAKWRMYCSNMKIIDEGALNSITVACEFIKKHYNEMKTDDKAPLPTEPTTPE